MLTFTTLPLFNTAPGFTIRARALVLAALAFIWPSAAFAEVEVHFHSFNGSVLWGRYPHTFIVLEGTLEDGTRVDENYGFSSRNVTPSELMGPVEHMVLSEKPKTVRRTNRHFSVTLSDADYVKVVKLIRSWNDMPGKFYDLDNRNCIHFVGEIARLVGLKVEYPDTMLRGPKKWLNHISAINPELGVEPVD